MEEVDKDDDGMDDDNEEEAEPVDGVACNSQYRCASSPGEERVCVVASALNFLSILLLLEIK